MDSVLVFVLGQAIGFVVGCAFMADKRRTGTVGKSSFIDIVKPKS